MRRLGAVFILATATVLAPATLACAADSITLPTSTAAALPVEDGDVGAFDWGGFYAGVYGAAQSSPAGGTQLGLGVDLGVSAAFDFVLVGAEVALHGLNGGAGTTTYIEATGRAGVLLSDTVAAYGAIGYGLDLGTPAEPDLLLGGGVELALTDDVTLRAQYLHGFPLTGGTPKDQFTLGANYHF